MVPFSAQEIRNILSGLDRQEESLEPFAPSDNLYVVRRIDEKTFTIYDSNDLSEAESLLQIGPDEEAAFGFFNRYYMLRANSQKEQF